MPLPWQKGESVEQIQEQIEALELQAKKRDLELTVAQKDAMIKRLKSQGVGGADFGWNWTSIKNWLHSRGLW